MILTYRPKWTALALAFFAVLTLHRFKAVALPVRYAQAQVDSISNSVLRQVRELGNCGKSRESGKSVSLASAEMWKRGWSVVSKHMSACLLACMLICLLLACLLECLLVCLPDWMNGDEQAC